MPAARSPIRPTSRCAPAEPHADIVQVEYGPALVSQAARWVLANHDPSQLNCHGPDVGIQYRSVISLTTRPTPRRRVAKKAVQSSGR